MGLNRIDPSTFQRFSNSGKFRPSLRPPRHYCRASPPPSSPPSAQAPPPSIRRQFVLAPMSFLAAALSKIATPLKSFFSPSVARASSAASASEKNPIRTPPTPHWRSPVPSNLTPAEKKKRRVSFRKGFKVQGNTGWDTPVLPGEIEPTDEQQQQQPVSSPSPTSAARQKKLKGRKATPALPRTSSAGKAGGKASSKVKPIKRAALSAKESPKSKVKTEPTRDLPSRRTRTKKGFYNEKRLQNLVWRGAGTAGDPINF